MKERIYKYQLSAIAGAVEDMVSVEEDNSVCATISAGK